MRTILIFSTLNPARRLPWWQVIPTLEVIVMARLQIVTLPTLTVGAVSSPEYLLVLDEVDGDLEADLILASKEHFGNLKEATGARGVLVFTGTIEVVQ